MLVHYDSQVAVALNSFNLGTTDEYFLRREKSSPIFFLTSEYTYTLMHLDTLGAHAGIFRFQIPRGGWVQDVGQGTNPM